MNFGSLFAGIGGLDLGLERAGMECAWQVEIDEYATRILERHWPNVRRWKDIKSFPPDASGLRRDIGRAQQSLQGTRAPCDSPEWTVDLICGGFPCQDISYAGYGGGLEAKRSGLFFEALRVVRQLRPRFVLLENVAALLTRGLDRVCGELAQIGYDCEWHCISAASIGAPHIRDRVFIYAESCGCRTGGTGRSVNASTGESISQRSLQVTDSNGKRLEGAELQRQRIGIMQRLSDCGWWSTEPDVGRVANGVPNRVDRLRGLGNAVVPQVAEWIGRQIIAAEKLDKRPTNVIMREPLVKDDHDFQSNR